MGQTSPPWRLDESARYVHGAEPAKPELTQPSAVASLGRRSIVELKEQERDAELPWIYAVLPAWLQWLYLLDWLIRSVHFPLPT